MFGNRSSTLLSRMLQRQGNLYSSITKWSWSIAAAALSCFQICQAVAQIVCPDSFPGSSLLSSFDWFLAGKFYQQHITSLSRSLISYAQHVTMFTFTGQGIICQWDYLAVISMQTCFHSFAVHPMGQWQEHPTSTWKVLGLILNWILVDLSSQSLHQAYTSPAYHTHQRTWAELETDNISKLQTLLLLSWMWKQVWGS